MTQVLDKLLEIKQTKPWLFWVLGIILLPLIILWVVKEFGMTFLAGQAHKEEAETQLKDAALRKATDAYKVDAAKEQQKADDLEKQANEVSVGEDWNKK